MTRDCRENPAPKALSRLATVRQTTASVLALVLGAAVAVALASCGSGEDAQLLPGDTAREITANLDTVQQLADEGECVGAGDAAEEVSSQVEALEGVDEKLQQALERGAVRLNEVVAACEEVTTEAIEPATVPTIEETTKEPPGQEKKQEKEEEKEAKEKEKEEDLTEKEPPTTPTETTPTTPPTTPTPPSESGGTGAPGGVSPASPVEEDDD